MMEKLPIQHLAELHAKGCHFALQVNGVDVAEFADHSADVFSTRLNVWLKQGHNTVEASFRPLGSGRLSTRLEITAVDSERNPTEAFDSGETGGRPIQWSLDVHQHTGSALERLSPAGSLAAESAGILLVASDLHQALVDRSFERLVELQKVQLEEKSVAVGLSAARSIAGYRDFIEEMWNSPGWQVFPFDPAVKPTRLPGLMQVIDRSNTPAIRARNGEARFSINPYLAKLSGKWTIIR